MSVAAAGRRPPHSAQTQQAAPIKRRTAYRKSELKQRSQREPKRHCHVAKSTRTKNDVSPQRPRQPARETLRHLVSAASERESSRLPARSLHMAALRRPASAGSEPRPPLRRRRGGRIVRVRLLRRTVAAGASRLRVLLGIPLGARLAVVSATSILRLALMRRLASRLKLASRLSLRLSMTRRLHSPRRNLRDWRRLTALRMPRGRFLRTARSSRRRTGRGNGLRVSRSGVHRSRSGVHRSGSRRRGRVGLRRRRRKENAAQFQNERHSFAFAPDDREVRRLFIVRQQGPEETSLKQLALIPPHGLSHPVPHVEPPRCLLFELDTVARLDHSTNLVYELPPAGRRLQQAVAFAREYGALARERSAFPMAPTPIVENAVARIVAVPAAGGRAYYSVSCMGLNAQSFIGSQGGPA